MGDVLSNLPALPERFNVLYISPTSQIGGGERSLLALIDRLDRSKFYPVIVCPNQGPLVNELKVINVIRKYKPRLVIIPYSKDRHPDHENSYRMLKGAIFISGLEKFKTKQKSYRPDIVINYMLSYQFKPSFIVDISRYYKTKVEAVTAYESQFYSDKEKKIVTHIALKWYFDVINSRGKFYGLKIKSEYGEPFFIESDIKIEDPLDFFKYLFY